MGIRAVFPCGRWLGGGMVAHHRWSGCPVRLAFTDADTAIMGDSEAPATGQVNPIVMGCKPTAGGQAGKR